MKIPTPLMQAGTVCAGSGIGDGCRNGTEYGGCSDDSVIVMTPCYILSAVFNLVALALLEASSACAMAVWKQLCRVICGGPVASTSDNEDGEGVRPLPLRVRRRRITRRRPRGRPAARVRAVCRRMEAYVCIWLALSNHLMSVQLSRTRAWQPGTPEGCEHCGVQRPTGADGDFLHGGGGGWACHFTTAATLAPRCPSGNAARGARHSGWWT